MSNEPGTYCSHRNGRINCTRPPVGYVVRLRSGPARGPNAHTRIVEVRWHVCQLHADRAARRGYALHVGG